MLRAPPCFASTSPAARALRDSRLQASARRGSQALGVSDNEAKGFIVAKWAATSPWATLFETSAGPPCPKLSDLRDETWRVAGCQERARRCLPATMSQAQGLLRLPAWTPSKPTAPGCPSAQQITLDVERRVREVAGLNDVKVEVVWDPPWTKDRMSDAAKLSLGML